MAEPTNDFTGSKNHGGVGDFGKEAPFQADGPRIVVVGEAPPGPYDRSYMREPSQLDRIEQMLTLLLGAPAPTGVGRSTPAAGCAEPSATPSRNPSADSFIVAQPLTEKPRFVTDPPIPEGSISYTMRFVDEEGEPIKGEPRVFLDAEQTTPAWEPSEGDIVVVSASPSIRTTVRVGRRCEHSDKASSNVTNAKGFEVQCLPHDVMRPATPKEIQQWEAEQEAKKPLKLGMLLNYYGNDAVYLGEAQSGHHHIVQYSLCWDIKVVKRSEFKVLEP